MYLTAETLYTQGMQRCIQQFCLLMHRLGHPLRNSKQDRVYSEPEVAQRSVAGPGFWKQKEVKSELWSGLCCFFSIYILQRRSSLPKEVVHLGELV